MRGAPTWCSGCYQNTPPTMKYKLEALIIVLQLE